MMMLCRIAVSVDAQDGRATMNRILNIDLQSDHGIAA
jgi:hypothetical protein